jgi:hypothetical protein
MFTKLELNVLHSALRSWIGPYGVDASMLENFELEQHGRCIEIAENLAERFEEILQHYFEMENKS